MLLGGVWSSNGKAEWAEYRLAMVKSSIAM